MHWIADLRMFWNEQYLLRAFPALNSKFKIEVAARLIAREIPGALGARFPDFAGELPCRRRKSPVQRFRLVDGI